MEWLHNPIGPLSVQQWGLVIFVLVAGFALYNVFSSKAAAKTAEGLTRARCVGCGWEGNVSKFHRTCPKCGNQITRMSRHEV
jgi:hypothetical protein